MTISNHSASMGYRAHLGLLISALAPIGLAGGCAQQVDQTPDPAPAPATAQPAPPLATGVPAFLRAMAAGPEAVAARIRYPLSRPFPLAPLRDRRELLAVYDEVFPPALRRRILASDPATAWRQVGWRGRMFEQGTLWVDKAGWLTARNGSSVAQARRREAAVAADRALLHASLHGEFEPVLQWTTESYRIRVDRLGDGKLRYASWMKSAPMNAKPDLVLATGRREMDGSGGNEVMTWTNGRFRYQLSICRLGTAECPPFELSVLESGTERLRQAAKAVFPG